KVLVEENIKNNVSESDMYEIIPVFTELFESVIIAFYDHQMNHYDLNKFGETLVLNRGVIGRVFNDIEKAKQWLLSYDFADENKNNAETISELILLLLVFSFILKMSGSSVSM
ncbi:MAG: hypothetical protein D6735_08230, partial [Acidobacteria bacterium]